MPPISPIHEPANKIAVLFSATLIALIVGCSEGEPVVPTAPQNPAPPSQPVTLEPVELEFAFLEGGIFLMGSENGQPDERPVHEVELSPFYMGITEVTQAQYEAVMGSNPSEFKDPLLPVERVVWAEADAFCRKLNDHNGGSHRLPTEAEWEYAARAGAERLEYPWGNQLPPTVDGVPVENVADISFRYHFRAQAESLGYVRDYNDGFVFTAPVGSFPENAFGLHDMGGNVAEWVSDYYVLGTQYYAVSPRKDPTGPDTGSDRAIRGASWWGVPNRNLRVAARFRDRPDLRTSALGFRCVKEHPDG